MIWKTLAKEQIHGYRIAQVGNIWRQKLPICLRNLFGLGVKSKLFSSNAYEKVIIGILMRQDHGRIRCIIKTVTFVYTTDMLMNFACFPKYVWPYLFRVRHTDWTVNARWQPDKSFCSSEDRTFRINFTKWSRRYITLKKRILYAMTRKWILLEIIGINHIGYYLNSALIFILSFNC